MSCPRESRYIDHGIQTPWLTIGKSYRFSPPVGNGPRLHGGNPIGNVPAADSGVS